MQTGERKRSSAPGQGGTRVPVTGLPLASPGTRLGKSLRPPSDGCCTVGVGVSCLHPHLCEACVQSFGSLILSGSPSKLCDVGQVIEFLSWLTPVNAAGRSHCSEGSDDPRDRLLQMGRSEG